MKLVSIFILTMLSFACFAEDAVVATASIGAIIAGGVVMIIEYILGKTTLIKPNSTLDLIISAVVKILKALFGTSESK